MEYIDEYYEEEFLDYIEEVQPEDEQDIDFEDKDLENLTNKKYRRPEVDSLKINNYNDIHFMLLDTDYYVINQGESIKTGEKVEDVPKAPIIRLYGVTKDQNSIMIHVKGKDPYLYIQIPKNILVNEMLLENLKNELNKQSINMRSVKSKYFIKKIEITEGESIKNFKGKDYEIETFLKIYTFLPAHVSTLRGIFEKGFHFESIQFPRTSFESNMPFSLRFMIDKDIVGMGWINLKKNMFEIRSIDKHKSRCQIEIDIHQDNLEAMDINLPECIEIAPLRIFSFDIECQAKDGGFPNAQKDPIIQISTVLKIHDQQDDLVKTVFTIGSCSNIPGCIVKSYEKEEDLLKEWEIFMQFVDPDIYLGYNIINFDFPYIFDRAKKLNVNKGKFGYMGRIKTTISKIKDGKFQSKAMGLRETKEINFEGRIQLDMFIHMQKEQKLSSYSLNTVSYHFLNEQKEDVHHTQISVLQEGNSETRKRLAIYCLKDSQLPLKLMQKLMCIYNYTEMARVTGVPINYLFVRGQQIKVASQLYRKAKLCKMFIPTERSKGQGDKFEGAFVLEPKRGFYSKPIATLDFASLYPSIMMAHNLCYSTLITRDITLKMNKDDYTATPNGDYFVKPHIRKGILPEILKELLNARKKAKNDLTQETDPLKKAVLDGRQLALKISANSVYGFTGAQLGQLPCLQISSSVTSFGRNMIEGTRDFVLEHFSKKNGYEYDSDVIYGDTDSVMVQFGVPTIQEAMNLGKEAASLITKKLFINPIKLEFEKVYCPYLLINKKRYAGLYFTKPDKYDKIDTKGMENVRRDNCQMIRDIMNNCLKYVLVEFNNNGVEKAIEYIKGMVSDLYQNKIDISKLVITKSLTKKAQEGDDEDDENEKKTNKDQYKSKQAHVELAKKMALRDAGSAPSIGDRIPFVIIAGSKNAKNYEKVEDPIYVVNHDIPLDYDYYIEKQIKKPLIRIFEHIMKNPDTLFQGEHTKIRYQPKLNAGLGLGKFVVKKETCLYCKCQVPNKEALCQNCVGKNNNRIVEIYTEKLIMHQSIEYQFNQLWTECQRCQGSLHDDVICQNRDCPIYYKRTKTQGDLMRSQEIINRFQNW
ncbi:hypothetical protein IMG5_161090 [Ichthyophthirius multifiliis]|uniref:DNA polymerase n=1 Tax=Ichthyophthirius multifiliis TaxID=5932 RepID=G0R010_ICHMU|nr:hypothetical protein IMG5_161090 [Ichthyophthirius multifiliis]EGR29193.1 hypothetical protein IMG5_161090 [Ichthyophthirius multifiliis]|eukprot:XP_004030429.1 hypothetical protein IMG5_161090 [Ichthyophthirius multifiliis]